MSYFPVPPELVINACANALTNAEAEYVTECKRIEKNANGHSALWRWFFGVKEQHESARRTWQHRIRVAKQLREQASVASSHVYLDEEAAVYVARHSKVRWLGMLQDDATLVE